MKIGYNIFIMAKRFSSRKTRKTTVRLSPKDAEMLLRKEFSDENGNKHIYQLRFKPQSPFENDFKQTSIVRIKGEE